MKKIHLSYILFLIFSLPFKQIQAQFNQYDALGISTYYVSNPVLKGLGYCFTNSIRINVLTISNEVKISAGTHFSIGYAKNPNESYVILDGPIVGELNFGNGSSDRSTLSYGVFLGAGIGYNMLNKKKESAWSEVYRTKGLYVNGGVKFQIKKKSFGIRVSYLNCSNKKDHVYGLGLMYNIINN